MHAMPSIIKHASPLLLLLGKLLYMQAAMQAAAQVDMLLQLVSLQKRLTKD
jgi:hypothetical protein